jgi:hypothetical protein
MHSKECYLPDAVAFSSWLGVEILVPGARGGDTVIITWCEEHVDADSGRNMTGASSTAANCQHRCSGFLCSAITIAQQCFLWHYIGADSRSVCGESNKACNIRFYAHWCTLYAKSNSLDLIEKGRTQILASPILKNYSDRLHLGGVFTKS